jgi:6-pyruvoyltetrahydropterin/6-carboxytetrahydropterin synthase
MDETYCIEVAAESLHFSAAHLAAFGDGSFEPLHGHNYGVAVRLTGRADAAGMVLDVSLLKVWVKDLCHELDHRVLVPVGEGPLGVKRKAGTVELRAGLAHYVLPASDCAFLPIANTTMEYLARHLADRLAERLRAEAFAARWEWLEVRVAEAPGQWASWRMTAVP